MSNPPSNTRRFINAAWSLLTFQLIASVGAVGVTWYAVQHVNDVRAGYAGGVPSAGTDMTGAEPASPAAAPATAAPAEAAATPAEAAPALAQCSPSDSIVHVAANAGWCDTGIRLHPGDEVEISVSGAWSNVLEGSNVDARGYGSSYSGTIVPEVSLASLVGKVGDSSFAVGVGPTIVSPAEGTLQFAMNDTDYTDNRGMIYVAIVQIRPRVVIQ